MNWDKEQLKNLYWEQNKSLRQIADQYGTKSGDIRYAMKKLDIPRRTLSQALLNIRAKSLNRELLQKLYWEDNRSTYDIANTLHISRQTIKRAFKRYNIPLRSNEQRMKLAGIKLSAITGKARGKGWKGGRIKSSSGYIKVQCPDHPYADGHGYVLEHRLTMEKRIGRYLLPWEKVHHIDGIRNHNTDDNLQLISPSDHTLYTRMCAHCELRTRVKLLEWHIKDLREQLQYKLADKNLVGDLWTV